MTDHRSLRSAYYLVETILIAPGVVSHEWAHLLACRLAGVTVLERPGLDPTARDATLVHQSVDSFGTDFLVAIAPLPINTILGVVAFTAANALPAPLSWLCYWLGGCFALTAFPSVGDTETLTETAGQLSSWLRPAGYLLALPLRWFTGLPGSAGIAGFVWMFVLFAWSRVGVALLL